MSYSTINFILTSRAIKTLPRRKANQLAGYKTLENSQLTNSSCLHFLFSQNCNFQGRGKPGLIIPARATAHFSCRRYI